MKVNFKFIAIFFLIIALCGIVSGDLVAEISAPQAYVAGGSYGSTTAALFPQLNLTLNNIQMLQGLSTIYSSGVDLERGSNTSIWGSYSTPVSFYAGSQKVSDGTISFNFVSNTSPAAAIYQIQYFPSTNITVGNLNGSVSLAIQPNSYTTVPSWLVSTQIYFASAHSATTSQTSAFISYSSYQLSGGGAGLTSNSANWLYHFKNIGSVTNVTGGYTIAIQKQNIANGYSGFSINWIKDGLTTFYNGNSGNNDISLFSASPPIIMSIQDPNTLQCWTQSWYYPIIYLAPLSTNGTINTPYIINIYSSSGVIPSDVNQISFTTNHYNSNNIYSNLLYDANTTIRHPLNFYKIGSIWYQSDGNAFNIVIGTSFPNSIQTQFLTANDYTVNCILSSSLIGGFAAGNNIVFHISGASNLIFAKFSVNDARTGATISNSNIGIFDVPAQHWTNFTLADGTLLIPLQGNYYYSYQGTANNYQPSSFTPLITGQNITIPINLIPTNQSIITGNTTLSVTVESSTDYSPLSGATVSVSSTNGYSSNLVTSNSGLALFTVPNNSSYTANVILSGYSSGSAIVTVGTNAAMALIYLSPVGITPTSIITVPTTLTTGIGIGNTSVNSSGANGNGQCLAAPSGGFLGAIYNFFACEGISTQAGEYIACAFAMVLLGLYVGGRYGGGLGAVIGAAGAYVFDLLIGWLPLWTLIAFLCVSAVIMGAKIFLSTE